MFTIPSFSWAVVLAIACLIFGWHEWQRRQFARYLEKHKHQDMLAKRLLSLAGQRSWQVAFCFGCMAVLVYGAIRQQHFAERQAVFLRQRLAVAESRPASEPERLAPPAKPDMGSEEMQQKLDALKERYEETFVNYYYLKRCNLATAQEFHLINSSLLYELSLIDAPAGLRNSVLQAARGTSKEMYGDSPCDNGMTAPMRANLNAYLSGVTSSIHD